MLAGVEYIQIHRHPVERHSRHDRQTYKQYTIISPTRLVCVCTQHETRVHTDNSFCVETLPHISIVCRYDWAKEQTFADEMKLSLADLIECNSVTVAAITREVTDDWIGCRLVSSFTHTYETSLFSPKWSFYAIIFFYIFHGYFTNCQPTWRLPVFYHIAEMPLNHNC